MISFEMKGNLQGTIDRIGRWRAIDPIPLARRLREILIEENAEGLKRGVDADGVEMAELRESTVERGRGGFGPPLIPRFSASWPIARFEVAIAREGDGYLIRAGWPGVEFAKYHQTGTKHMAARPIAGFRPSTNAQIDEAMAEFIARFIGDLG
jgi:hypothetical protein